jgi:preprotein translocase subunit SecA
MNVQLVNSLVEIVSKLTPEDQKLFLSKLSHRNIRNIIPSAEQQNLTSEEKVAQFQEWLSQFPQSIITLSDEALRRENIYDDRGI